MPARTGSGGVAKGGTYKRPPKKKRPRARYQGIPSPAAAKKAGSQKAIDRSTVKRSAPSAPPRPDVTLGGDVTPRRSGHKKSARRPAAAYSLLDVRKKGRKGFKSSRTVSVGELDRSTRRFRRTDPERLLRETIERYEAGEIRTKAQRDAAAKRLREAGVEGSDLLDKVSRDVAESLDDSAMRQIRKFPLVTAITAGKKLQPKPLRRELEGKGEVAKFGEKLKEGVSNANLISAPRGRGTTSASVVPPGAEAVARDAIDLATNFVPSTYMTADAIVDAAKGDPKKVKKLWDDFKKTSAIPAAIDGNFREAWKRTKAHPLITAAEVSGAKALVGRSAGATARRVPGKGRAAKKVRKAGSQKRANLHLYPKHLNGPQVERRYSPDLIDKAVQVAGENLARKEVKVRGRTVKKARDPEVDRGLPSLRLDQPRTRRKLLRQVDTRVHGQEGIRRARREKVARDTTDLIPPRDVPAAARRIARNRSGIRLADAPLAHFFAEGTAVTPKTWRADLGERLAALRASHPEAKRHSREHARKNEAEQKAIQRLLGDTKLTPEHVEKVYSAALEFAQQEHGRQVRLQEGAQYTREQEQSRLMPVAQAHMGAKPALERIKTPEQLRYEELGLTERRARSGVRKAERRLEVRKVKAARIQGAAEVRVAQADRALLERDNGFVEARQELTRAQRELTESSKALDNAVSYGKGGARAVSGSELTALRKRYKSAQAASSAARRAVKREHARVIEQNSGVNSRPVGTLRSLEKAKGLEGEAELQLGRAVEHYEGVRKARREAKVPKGKRSRQPWLLDDKGRELRPDEVEAFLREAGRDPESVALISQRPVKTKSTAYIPTTRDGTSPPAPPGKRRTGTAYELGARDVGAEPMLRQALFSESQATATENFKRLVGEFGVYPRANHQLESSYDRAATIGRELVGDDEHPLVPVNVAHLYAAGRQLEEIRRKTTAAEPDAAVIEGMAEIVKAAFQRPPDGKGRFVLMPEDVVTRLRQHNFTLTAVEQYTQSITNLWKDNVLTTSSPATWLTNNTLDLGMRSLFAGIGPLSVVRGRRIVKAAAGIEKRRGEEIAESLTGGSLYGASERANVHRATKVGTKSAARVAAAPWRTWRDGVYHLEQKIERLPQYGAVGKAAAQDIKMKGSLKGLLKVMDEQVEDYARSLTTSTAREARLQKAVEDVVGRWGKVSPSMRRTLGIAPFAQWLGAALRYVYITLPTKHPMKLAFAAAMYEATDPQRKAAGLSTDIPVDDRLLGYLQGGISLAPDDPRTDKKVEGEILRLQRAFSFGTAAGFPTNLQEFAVSQFRSPALALLGVGWNGEQLVYPDGHPRAGRPLSVEDKAKVGAGLLVEGFVPFSSMYRKVVLERGRSADPASTILDVKTRPKWDPRRERYVHEPTSGSVVPQILDWLNPWETAKPYRERDIDAILAAKRRGQTFNELDDRRPKSIREEFQQFQDELKQGDPGGVREEFREFLKEGR